MLIGTYVPEYAFLMRMLWIDGSLQTRPTVFASFPGFERLRAPMGPISGGVGSLGMESRKQSLAITKFMLRRVQIRGHRV